MLNKKGIKVLVYSLLIKFLIIENMIRIIIQLKVSMLII